ncbi:hypothetical protein TVAG_260830 [Trichomonas vaginalis G3]|uniref:Right handed beta helix domain-containing protein n=1 Tax=Trichomonas vaginalis (strain ATCC PRA-98 / G3) TaxID=412133 RepID=A2EXK6_TRIV3|nr:F-box only protein family [Trichomonas vaginalis G3]EAY02623.1 hypothetical protein TVAG_260830 [Trichomonas vaginalis G3]KAI5553346.1 F-box only protein family [Trichomonas vaginalis G3]|eukprot:XP_001314846.1 hypothetical protein [Trichomonas vaginalis G3]
MSGAPNIPSPSIPGRPAINVPGAAAGVGAPRVGPGAGVPNFGPPGVGVPRIGAGAPGAPPVAPFTPGMAQPSTNRRRGAPMLSSSTKVLNSLQNAEEHVQAEDIPADQQTAVNTEDSAELANLDESIFNINRIQKPTYEQNSDFTGKIAESIERAPEGSVLHIPPGTYHESLIITKKIHLVAQGECTIVSDCKSDTIAVQTDGVILTGFTILQEESQAAGALRVETGSAIFEDCNFDSRYMPTIAIRNSAIVNFTKCIIECHESNIIIMTQQAQAVFTETTVQKSAQNGVVLRNQTKALFEKCIFNEIGRCAIISADKTEFFCDDSTIMKIGGEGISISSCGQNTIVAKTQILECANVGILSYVVSTPVVRECTIKDCGRSLIEVTDGAALRSIQNRFQGGCKQALFATHHTTIASEGDTFQNLSFGIVGVERAMVYIVGSKFMDQVCGVVLSGQNVKCEADSLVCSDCSENGIFLANESSIMIANAEIKGCRGTGLLSVKSRDVWLRNCTFDDNKNNAIEFQNSNMVRIDYCKIYRSFGCGIIATASKITMKYCRFEDNNFYSIYTSCSTYSATECTIRGAKSDAIYVDDGKLDISWVRISDTTDVAIVCDKYATANIDKCIIEQSKIGIFTCEESRTNISQTTIDNTQNGIQISAKSDVRTRNCLYTNNKVGVAATDNAKILTYNDKYEANNTNVYLENGGEVTCDADVMLATEGPGIYIQKGTANLKGSLVKNAKNVGVYCKGKVTIQGCRIEACGSCGVVLEQGSEGVVKGSTIKENGDVGIMVSSGASEVSENNISGHKCYGLRICNDAEIAVIENSMFNNGICDISRD